MKNGFLGKGILAILTIVVVLPEANAGAARGRASKVFVPRFQFKIDPKASFAELLPTAPKAQLLRLYPDKLADVPEVAFDEMPLPESADMTRSGESKTGKGRKEDVGQHGPEFKNME